MPIYYIFLNFEATEKKVNFFQNSVISCSGRSPVRPPLTHSMQEVVVMCEGHEWVWQLP